MNPVGLAGIGQTGGCRHPICGAGSSFASRLLLRGRLRQAPSVARGDCRLARNGALVAMHSCRNTCSSRAIASPWTGAQRIAVHIASFRSFRQLVSLTLVHDLAGRQVHGEHPKHGDSFKDHSSQTGNGRDGNGSRCDLVWSNNPSGYAIAGFSTLMRPLRLPA